MMDRKHQRQVEERLKHALQIDKARVQTGRISRFGLLEMSRQRLRPSLGESSQEPCPRCDGHGTIRGIESLALSILRLLEEASMKEFSGQIVVQAPPKVANFMLNEKRKVLSQIEARHDVPIIVLANEYMQRPKFEIHRMRTSEITDAVSYSHIEQPQAELVASAETQAAAAVAATPAAVTGVTHSRPAPTPVKKSKPGIFGQFFTKLFSGGEQEPAPEKRETRQRSGKKKTGGRPAQRSRSAQQSKKRTSNTRSRGRRQSGQSEAQKAGQAPNQSKKTRRKKAARKKTGQPANRKKQAARQQASPTAAPQEKTEGTSPRSGRRRRSPYQTGGGKQREAQADSGTSSEKQTSDAGKQESRTQTSQATSGGGSARPDAKPDQAMIKQTDKPLVKAEPEKQAKSDSAEKSKSFSDSKKSPEATKKAENVKETSSRPKPAEAAKQPKAEKKSSSQPKPPKASAKEIKPASSKPGKSQPAASQPAVQVSQDSKGIYTLKSTSKPSDSATTSSAKQETPPSTGSGD